MNSKQYQSHLVECLQWATDEDLARIYEDYLDEATLSLMNGLVVECQRRGLSLMDLEDILINQLHQ